MPEMQRAISDRHYHLSSYTHSNIFMSLIALRSCLNARSTNSRLDRCAAGSTAAKIARYVVAQCILDATE